MQFAIVAAIVYSFVRAMTAISAVIFLVSAEYDMATSYIIGRVENGDYGLAIAYASVLIVVMVMVVGLVQLVVGQRELGRRRAALDLAGDWDWHKAREWWDLHGLTVTTEAHETFPEGDQALSCCPELSGREQACAF